ncbi:hypothetical protein SS50377_21799 [Spironucleus salmonicida]|uniref:Uncharacterized protein n=1 Tax=Spironucleus salmonicida TaxID=348837 RepID=V6LXA4_9EUKA|nr:hypothetical protein SS50377_21799 [Spironucleus salmonicida]|eukprot:EST45454.1 Hypothetical protein SS50377_14606 [Spironucleus salmonicida]
MKLTNRAKYKISLLHKKHQGFNAQPNRLFSLGTLPPVLQNQDKLQTLVSQRTKMKQFNSSQIYLNGLELTDEALTARRKDD